MRDVRIWQALHGASETADAFAALLDELAQAPLPKRAMFLGPVVPATDHRSPKVRAAALRALAGCFGVDRKRAIAARLDDANADVRAAAVRALAQSCVH